MYNILKGELYLKAKVFVSYAIILFLFSSIIFFTFDSFQKLTHSTDTLAQPNPRIGLLHDIIFSIYQAESNIRSFGLTEQERFLNAYFEELENINSMVDSLYHLADHDQFIIETIDSINIQLLSKTRLLGQLIQVKRLDRNSIFYEKALDDILQATGEETKLREIEHQSIIDKVPVEIQENEKYEITKEKDNLLSRVRNFFSGSRDVEASKTGDVKHDEKSQLEIMVREIRTDSIITVYRDTENLKEEIENTMVGLMETMLSNQQRLQRRENNILLEDKRVMDKIWDYVTLLEDYERENVLKEAENAHATVNSTTNKIFLTVLVSVFILLIFSWMFINDVNKSRFYKKQLLQQKARAEELVETKQRFMANISHEIRTPLNSIIGFSRQLQKNDLDTKPKSYAEAIKKSSKHLLGIVNDLLDFSKIEAGKVKLESIPIDLTEIAEDVGYSLKVLAQEKNIEFQVKVDNLKNPYVLGDPLRIRQILINIGGNGIKFTSKGSVILSISDFIRKDNPETSYVRFRIKDTGIGISSADKERIFDEFAQSDSKASRHHGGTGLGLSISKKLVELMDGKIELISTPGKGTVITIYLPFVNSSKEDIENSDSIGITPKQMSASILLVDDDRLNRLLIQSILDAFEGIDYFEAENADAALKIMAKHKFDLVITDIQMPGVSGTDMVRHMRSIKDNPNTDTLVMACTADITPETLSDILDSGIDDYILKPVDEDLLLQKIQVLLGTDNHLKELVGELKLMDPIRLKESAVDEINGNLYDLSGLTAFTGNDPSAVMSVISVFIDETKSHISLLKNGLSADDLQEIKSVAHKMSNMCQLLQVHGADPHLYAINNLTNGGVITEETRESTLKLIEVANELIDSLEIEIETTLNKKS